MSHSSWRLRLQCGELRSDLTESIFEPRLIAVEPCAVLREEPSTCVDACLAQHGAPHFPYLLQLLLNSLQLVLQFFARHLFHGSSKCSNHARVLIEQLHQLRVIGDLNLRAQFGCRKAAQ